MISIYFAHEVPSKCFCGAFRLVIVLFISQGGRNFFVCLIVMANNSSGNNILLAAAAGALVGTGFGLLVGGRLGRGHGGGGAVIFDQEAIERVVSKYPRVKSAGVFSMVLLASA